MEITEAEADITCSECGFPLPLWNRTADIAGALSHGDRKTLDLALGNRPELIVLDEPTSGMSPEETGATIALIRQLALDRGPAILFCEHDLNMVFTVAQNIMGLPRRKADGSALKGIPDLKTHHLKRVLYFFE